MRVCIREGEGRRTEKGGLSHGFDEGAVNIRTQVIVISEGVSAKVIAKRCTSWIVL